MDELLELRSHIEHGRYPEALILIGAMEEMSREDKVMPKNARHDRGMFPSKMRSRRSPAPIAVTKQAETI
jgi:hypothetical protein